MKTIVELNKEDIIKTIAKVFNVDAGCVLLEIAETWEGYANGEHRVQTIRASITTKGDSHAHA